MVKFAYIMSKHQHYHALNLIGYGLARYDKQLVHEFGFRSKQAFYKYIVSKGIAETTGVVKNRQDLFDPFFDNGRKGWWQKGDAYIHRKLFIEASFPDEVENLTQFAELIEIYLGGDVDASDKVVQKPISPVTKSKYRKMQETGREAETYFMVNYQQIQTFVSGSLQDARLYGDGYDFQISLDSGYYVAEVKGLSGTTGTVKMTEKEYRRAGEYTDRYYLVIISNLYESPLLSWWQNPINTLSFSPKTVTSSQTTYHSEYLNKGRLLQ